MERDKLEDVNTFLDMCDRVLSYFTNWRIERVKLYGEEREETTWKLRREQQ